MAFSIQAHPTMVMDMLSHISGCFARYLAVLASPWKRRPARLMYMVDLFGSIVFGNIQSY